MDNLPPPYSPPADEASTPQVVMNSEPTLPPSYDAATAGEAHNTLTTQLTASDDGHHDEHVHAPRSFRHPLSLLSSTSSGDSHPQPAAAASSTSPSSSSSFVSRLSALKHRRHSKSTVTEAPAAPMPAKVDDLLANIFHTHPWRRTWGPWPKSLDEALRKTALHGESGLVRALLDAGAPIRFTDRYAAIKIHDGSVLHAALRGGAPELADTIVSVFWGRVYSSQLKGDTSPEATYTATLVADTRTQSLVDARDGQGCSPLHVAAEAGATEAAQHLIRRGAEVDAVDDFGRTALHMAARFGRRETTVMLVGAGADATHLMPPLTDDGLAPLWADALERGIAGRERLAELGDHNFVTQLVASVVAEERGQKGDIKVPVRKMSGQKSSLSEASSSFDAPSYVHGSGRPKPTMVVTDPFTLPPDASSLKPRAPPAVLTPQRIHQDPWRRHKQPGHSVTSTPAYARWRDGLETLQTEHRAQKARNDREAVPEGMSL
ncbi:hypothetical protein SEUCBS140593_004021 [Sporothrix eucalyptigena]|uniref:Ankyrin repeat protein n=1 Tax=Sporothrix eucalyptigena TaxID=1812306 RepID=A0ABP0BJS0_9PEZI